MARLRHAVNPAKVKAQMQALDAPESPAPLPGAARRRGGAAAALCMLLMTPAALLASFAPFDYGCLAYAALAPWTLGLALWQAKRWPVLTAWGGGLLFSAASVYWLSWVTPEGYVGAVVYLSLYWLAAAWILRAAMARRWPMWLVLPTVWVAMEYARSYVISGFPWFYLAQSQYLNTSLIQIADTTGQYGVSFFVGMVNGLVVDAVLWLLRRAQSPRLPRGLVVAAAIVAASGAGLLVYGQWRLGQRTQTPGPVIALVQESVPIALNVPSPGPAKILQRHMELASRLEGKGAQLVLLPESMLPAGLNRNYMNAVHRRLETDKELLGQGRPDGNELQALMESIHWFETQQDYARQMEKMSHRLGAPILAGGSALEWGDRGLMEIFNSALWFDANGVADKYYSKVHLVPFSEYVPFRSSWPWLHQVLRNFVPAVMSQLEPGAKFMQFTLQTPSQIGHGPRAAAEQSWQIATPICYEGTFDYVCREMVQAGPRKADILANLSNDGWFIWQRDASRAYRSSEHSQHLAHYCFRAVENRVPVVRAVNTGISASIDSDGRVVARLCQGETRTMMAGVLLLDGGSGVQESIQHGPRVLVDSRATVYSLVGDVFAWLASAGALAMVVGLALRRGSKKE